MASVRWPLPIPAWFWQWAAWYLGRDAFKNHQQDPAMRPKDAPKRIPVWAWARLALIAAGRPMPTPKPPTLREQVVSWARWGAAHEPDIHYTESADRDNWLTAAPHNKLPLSTDCSGFATFCYFMAVALDPSGLFYKSLGYTGTILDHAAAHGRIVTDVSLARPGDPIVIGPGTGSHMVVCVEAGKDPLVVSHGWEGGPVEQRLSVDPRTPKRVCITLP